MEKKLIEELDTLHENGALKKLVKAGLVSSSVIMWRNLIHAYEARLSATGSKMQAMYDVSENFGISIETVRSVRRKFDC